VYPARLDLRVRLHGERLARALALCGPSLEALWWAANFAGAGGGLMLWELAHAANVTAGIRPSKRPMH
jgi:hypothetical protein